MVGTVTEKSCKKAAAYVHIFEFFGRLLLKTGVCANVIHVLEAYTVQSMHASSQHTVQSMHASIQYMGVQ